VANEMEQMFSTLLEKWIASTAHFSTIELIIARPEYSEIVSIGEEVIPLILRNIHQHTIGLSCMLSEITGVCPVKSEHQGLVKCIVQDCLQ